MPVLLGEFAVTTGSGEYVRERSSRILFLKTVMQTSLDNGWVPVLWDTGHEISRTDGSFTSEFSEVMNGLNP